MRRIARCQHPGLTFEKLGRLTAALAARQGIGQYGHHVLPLRRGGELVQRGTQVPYRRRRMSRCLRTAEFGQERAPARAGQFAHGPPQVRHSRFGVIASRGQACGGPHRADDPHPAGGFGVEQLPGNLLQRTVLVVQQPRGPVVRA
ncbi:hypothetical protein [Streptomyces sp. NPDC058773]|uniref:hypothetical protein n=1 Tax=Streptomyces sp. NPDC058773 TaxID=3346632 RepID=UPI00369FF795